jgi:hypothetical protein
MSLFSSLFSSKAPNPPSGKKELVYLMGTSAFKVEILGEENYQYVLEAIGGPRKPQGINCFETASLILEDKNGVRVEMREKRVGYLGPEAASLVRQRLIARGFPKGVGQCATVIRGGWVSSDGRKGPYKVWLDLPSLY